MAEILSISAAVVQFLDIALRLSLKIHSCCNELREVPHRLNNLRAHLMQQTELASSVQKSVLGSSVSLTDSSKALLKSILNDQSREMDLMLNLIDSVTSKANDRLIRRSWNGIQAIDKKKNIESACDQIEAKGNLLSLWLINTNV